MAGLYPAGPPITGSENIALGTSALTSNTTGSNNVAMGQQALKANQTGCHNVALGKWALYNNIGGNHNIALGYEAARYANPYPAAPGSGSNNLAMGYRAMYCGSTGWRGRERWR